MEDFENKYNSALLLMKKVHPMLMDEARQILEEAFPELAESEDERMLREIKRYIKEQGDKPTGLPNGTAAVADMIAWLEKQGEHTVYKESFNEGYKLGYREASENIAEEPEKYGLQKQGEQKHVELSKEDEKIRKCLLGHFSRYQTEEVFLNSIKMGDIVAWLDKQSSNAYELGYTEGMRVKNEEWLEKQGEQKSADKVKPKFEAGDWAVSDLDKMTRYISEVHNDKYNNYYVIKGDVETECNIDEYDRLHHLWTIQDAKAGDVLSDGTTIFIFKDSLSDDSVMSYCDYDTDSGESDAFCPLSVNLICSKITPATKEQRDLLFQKMKEAGYEWDTDKKELKEIEQKPTNNQFTPEQASVLDEHKDKFLEQKPAVWSEDDEAARNDIIDKLERIMGTYVGSEREICRMEIDWFKSLKPQSTWKPSDEQLDALHAAAVYVDRSMFPHPKGILMKLYEQLKKLIKE